MNEVAFVQQREPEWKRLHVLCDKADASPKNLQQEELRELISLYRKASSDLAQARTQSGNLQLIEFLNDLVGRAYMALYRPTRPGVFRSIGGAIATYAQVVRRRKWFVVGSMAVFFAAALFSHAILTVRPDLRPYLIAKGEEELFDGWKDGNMKERSGSESVLMTGFYAAHNPFVSVITGGVAAGSFGIATTILLWENGRQLGSLGHEMNSVGKLGFLLSSIAPHGVTEIQGIFIAGAAGYVLAWALIFPGQRRRADALRDAAKDGIVMLGGGVVLMFLAAPFEGFFSFSPSVPQPVKVVVALIVGTGWIVFYNGVGKTVEPAPQSR
ncbi:MAG: stage II sporulation protein M [Fimbriimonadaceae bacterium]